MQLASLCRFLVENVTAIEPVKKFPAFKEPEGSTPRSQAPPAVDVILSHFSPAHPFSRYSSHVHISKILTCRH